MENKYQEFGQVVQEVTTSIITRAEREAEEKAALILKNKERLRQATSARIRKGQAKKKYEEQREFHNQVGMAAGDMLRQFIQELQGLMLVPVGDLRDRDAVGRRKDQLNVIKETLSAVQLLMKFQASLAEEYNIKKADQKEGQGDNILLFNAANKLMKNASK